MSTKHLSTAVTLALLAGCYTTAADPTGASGSSAPTTIASVGDTGLPCDVQHVLATHCWSCHGTTPSKGVPEPLVSYSDLTADAGNAKTFAQVAVERMRSMKSTMPPSGAIDDADIAIVEAWVKAGAKQSSCADGVTGDLDIYATDPGCTSNTYWPKTNDRGSDKMHPGRACIDCHDRSGDAPSLVAAGTVYPTAHEYDDCNGKVTAGLSVVLTDAKGKNHKAAVNAAGNFYFVTDIPTPYKAKVVKSDGTVRAMSAAQTSGDCNACHGLNGKQDAPGRIMAP